jgi:putative protease
MKKPELLSPAAGFPSLAAAVKAGADSVYFGVDGLNMRANARNFQLKDLKKAADYCHKHKAKAYLTLNTIVYEDEAEKVKKILKEAKKAKVDAVILWDMSVLEEAKKLKLDAHLSTQASVSNSRAAEFYRKKGISRIVLARECSLKQIREIKKKTKAEIETFIHGAMCVSVSGRCFISQEIFGRSANRGDCLQPCRREYLLTDVEEKHKLRIGRKHIISPKDLCTLPFIDKMIEAGIDAFKIEGRNRAPEYVSKTTSVYRKAIDAYFEKKLTSQLKDELMKELESVYNRGFSSGFLLKKPSEKDYTEAYGSKARQKKVYAGYVKNYYRKAGAAEIKVEAHEIRKGDRLLIIGNKTGVVEETASSMQKRGKETKKAGKGENVGVKTKNLLRENDQVYLLKKAK